MENRQEHHHHRELTFLSSGGDFLLHSVDRTGETPPIREMDFFSSSSANNNEHKDTNDIDDNHHHQLVTEQQHDRGQHDDDSTHPHGSSITKDGSPTDHPAVNTGLNLTCASAAVSKTATGENPDETELSTLESELRRIQEENRKLRIVLGQITKSYGQLQAQLFIALQKQKPRDQNMEANGMVSRQIPVDPKRCTKMDANDASVSDDKMDHREVISVSPSNNINIGEVMSKKRDHDHDIHLTKLNLGKQSCPDPAPENDVVPDRSSSRSWGSSKNPKLEEQELPFRKARVSVRARSEAPLISDGCQWRKYGQKMAKGNPCPRAYYRCTMAAGCPVRKQVQRCAEDKTVLITTYEGNHNHPLPPAATAMANATSAAAAMLLSGSATSAAAAGYFSSLPPYASVATLSGTAPFPTVTLDLTHAPNNHHRTSSSSSSVPVGPAGVTFPLPLHASNSNSINNSHQLLGHPNLLFSQKLQQLPPVAFPLQLQRQPSSSMVDTVTAAIASDPNFTAALAAAISSIIGAPRGSDGGGSNNSVSTCTTFSTN